MATGLYVTPDGRVTVAYGNRMLSIPKNQYKVNGYQPSFEKLPVRDHCLNPCRGDPARWR